MTTSAVELEDDITHGHLFCGIGGGAMGFNRGQARVGKIRAKSVCVGGIDVDPASCRDFEQLVGVKATCLDLFTVEQYQQFHGKLPPVGWKQAMPSDVAAAFTRRPNIAFLSAPCKGFSGLLSEENSKSIKYQALNGLTLRGVWLLLEAYKDDPVELIVFENVPRIQTRGRFLLDQIIALLRSYGYAVAETTHDCGELGNLGQSRKRFLLVARHEAKVPPFLYEPQKHSLRGVGEILDRLPLPLSGLGGPMHRMPSLQWKTWVRLAFVRAGGDWRSLNDLAVEDGVLRDYGIVPGDYRNGAFGVTDWQEPAGTVTANGRPAAGSFSVADPRPPEGTERPNGGVGTWDQPAATITGQRSPLQGRYAVADPRRDPGRAVFGQYGVQPFDEPSRTVTGQHQPGGGPNSVADPRLDGKRFNSTFRIVRWDGPSPAVAGPGGPGNGLGVADPRFTEGPRATALGVKEWDQPAGVVAGESYPTNGPFAVSDPRGFGDETHKHVMKVTEWDEPGGAVTSAHSPSNGALSVADPRPPQRDDGYKQTKYRVTKMDEPAGAVIAASGTGNGAFAVADPRPTHGPNAHTSKHAVLHYDEPSRAVTGTDRVGSGALCVADPRPVAMRDGRKTDFEGGGQYGVVRYDEPANAVTAHGQIDNGRHAVADPRPNEGPPMTELPKPTDRLVCVIFALDGTWHRPFTTLELAAIQSLVDPEEKFELDGLSDAAWRERIGNCVPPASAEAIAGVMFETLLLARAGETFTLSAQPIWVRDVAVALSIKPQELPSW